MTFPCCSHCNLGTVAHLPVPCGDDHGDPCTHEGCPGREAEDGSTVYHSPPQEYCGRPGCPCLLPAPPEPGDPDGYDRNGAWDGFQVTSDAEGGL